MLQPAGTQNPLKFIYSEKTTKFCEISTVDLTATTYEKSKVEISQKFVAFSESVNFKTFTHVLRMSKSFMHIVDWFKLERL